MTRWKTYDPLAASQIPTGPGVYVVLIDGIVVYVGQSQRLRERIYSYKFRPGYAKNIILPWCSVGHMAHFTLKIKETRRMGDWAMWEIRLIDRLQPVFNIVHRKIKRAA